MANLGDFVEDQISGFKGVVLAKVEALYEAPRCRVHPTCLTEHGAIREGEWIEDDRLVVTEPGKIVKFLSIAGRELAADRE